jgi:phosphohistidine phosphatase
LKTLILARHAKSSWKELNLSDFKRPLNKRGKRDAPFMGKILNKLNLFPDFVISSPAVRASDTAKLICAELNIPEQNIKYDEEIYEASVNELLVVIHGIHNKFNSVMLFGHNPGLTSLANLLSGQYIDNIPTSGIVVLDYDEKNWKDIHAQSCTLRTFEYPKKYKEDS